FPGLFISQAINGGSNAIYVQLGLVTKMTFPSSVLLSISFMNSLINLSFMTLILIVISVFNSYVNPVYYLSLIYFVVASFILRSEEHTSELQSRFDLIFYLLLEKKNITN